MKESATKTKIQPVTLVAPKTFNSYGITISKSENHPEMWWVIYLLNWKGGNTACRPFEEKELIVIKAISSDEEPALFQAIETVKHPNQLQGLLNMEEIIKNHIPKEPSKKDLLSRIPIPALFSRLKG